MAPPQARTRGREGPPRPAPPCRKLGPYLRDSPTMLIRAYHAPRLHTRGEEEETVHVCNLDIRSKPKVPYDSK